MEEFDQSTASESQINSNETGDDELYEHIEAPKFVDFTVPDHHHPDDRYWFCLRVGCDQKHEEELDLEEINKNFVLRVMAARSPNIKIRKMLTRKQQSSTLKCPLTVPAKPSKSRISRLAVVSSISRKLTDVRDKPKPLSKHKATPKADSKKSNSVATKAFTTPRNRKRTLNNADKFRSVRNPKPRPSIEGPKTKFIARALVFGSPKKVVRVKTSLELKTPVGKLCAAMPKLEIATGKKRALETKTAVGKLCSAMSKLEIASAKKQALPSDKTARKQFRGREVKSRVFDSLRSHSKKDTETKPLKNMKRKKSERNLERSGDPKENYSIDKEIGEKSRHGSLEGCSVSDTSKIGEASCCEALMETSRTDVAIPAPSSLEEKASGDGGQSCRDTNEHEEKVESSEVKIGFNGVDSDDKENNLPSGDAEDKSEVNDNDDKENTSASENNREPKDNSEEKILVSHDLKKVNQVTKKPLKKNSVAANIVGGVQEAKYRKPKPTNPKPFRLRTDERGILKEATLEKKLVTPLKEIPTLVKSKSRRKYPTPSQESDENVQRQSENVNQTRENCETRMDKKDVDQPRKTRSFKTACLRTKTTAPTTSDRSSERTTKSPKIPAKPRGIGSSRKTVRLGIVKERPTSTILGHKDSAKPSENGASQGNKASGSNVPRSVSRGKMATTIPREPNFHSIHVPKSCTKKVA